MHNELRPVNEHAPEDHALGYSHADRTTGKLDNTSLHCIGLLSMALLS